jgi:DUF4097 and DUF4098 domain-containing protein YvlB
MSLVSNTGSITVRDGLLQANSSLTTNTGSVTFQGTIEREGSYQFLTDTGSVNVTVPSEAAFQVDANTTTGSITTAFPGVIVTRQNFMGSEAHGDVGGLPRATVTMRTTTGSINLQEGS